ncbi:MAG: hypothetical protein ACRC5A_12795 [Enterobacteriaceae bacterium]
MPKKNITIYDKLAKHLYTDESVAKHYLSESELKVKRRVLMAVQQLMENPSTRDTVLVSNLMDGFGGVCDPVSRSTAYADLSIIRRFVGTIRSTAKSWHIYTVEQMAKETYELAKAKGDFDAMNKAAAVLGKFTRADKIDEDVDYESLVHIPSFEPSDDVTLLEGLSPIENLEQERKKFRSLFKGDAQSVRDLSEDEEEDEDESNE